MMQTFHFKNLVLGSCSLCSPSTSSISLGGTLNHGTVVRNRFLTKVSRSHRSASLGAICLTYESLLIAKVAADCAKIDCKRMDRSLLVLPMFDDVWILFGSIMPQQRLMKHPAASPGARLVQLMLHL